MPLKLSYFYKQRHQNSLVTILLVAALILLSMSYLIVTHKHKINLFHFGDSPYDQGVKSITCPWNTIKLTTKINFIADKPLLLSKCKLCIGTSCS